MNVRRLASIAVATGLLALGSALPAAAHPDHDSCQGFGAFFADYAQEGYADDFGLENPGLGPFATLGPNVISETIAYEHELFC